VKQKAVQDACSGRGNVRVNKVSKSLSLLQNHSGQLSKDQEGVSVSAFSTPGM
jgi:hypothetical protein